MILRIELHFRQGVLDASVDRTDSRLWWRSSRPWAKLTVPVEPQPRTATEGLITGVVALYEALQLRECGHDPCTPYNSGG